MTNIECYMYDGACMQSQCVLAYLRMIRHHSIASSFNKDTGDYEAHFFVGRYENCREQGYVFSVYYRGEQINFAVYEHRNSDKLCVVQFNGVTTDTPSAQMVQKNMKDKYDVTISFDWMKIESCGDYIDSEIQNFINKLKNKED